ncbi:MAG: uroporphyrinogen decarboxylase family protein, partial [Chloroflexi bacterium]|nr:uroporphyrinogen decarboxylase family protein [Chloroflexota bacterium]
MKPKETIFAAFKRQPTERVPVTLFGGGMWTITHSGNTFLGLANDAVKMAGIIVETARLLDCDVVYVGSGYNNLHVASLGGKIKFRQIGRPDL